MNLIFSPCAIISELHPKQGITDLKNVGINEVVLDFAHFIRKLDSSVDMILHNNITMTYASYIFGDMQKKAMQEKGLFLISVHEAMRFSVKAGCEFFLLEPAVSSISKKSYEINSEYYLSYAELAKELGLTILIGNSCLCLNGKYVRGFGSDGYELAGFIERLNSICGSDVFAAYTDVGGLNLCGQDMQSFIYELGNKIKLVYLQDNDGKNDNSMLPFTAVSHGTSTTNWLSLIRGLRSIGYSGDVVLDIHDTLAAFSPLLKPAMLNLAVETGKFILWQIDMENVMKKYKKIILFGAGNMCRNYMLCYADKYPPLFTCDNNSKTWGTEFCGLEVKNPEVLSEMSRCGKLDDVGVFICNVYYREIEEQLRSMNINNIEFFNDEYLPKYPFDRLEMK